MALERHATVNTHRQFSPVLSLRQSLRENLKARAKTGEHIRSPGRETTCALSCGFSACPGTSNPN
jgi:hypothetical protein